MDGPSTGTRPTSVGSWLMEPCPRLVLSWTVAGGVGLVAVWESLELSQIVVRDRPAYNHMLLVIALFGLGTALGFLHGAVLAYLSRSDFCGTRRTRWQLLGTLLAAGPFGLFSFLVATWLALTSVALQTDARALWILPLLGWMASAVIWVYAAHESAGAVRVAVARWVLGRRGLTLAVVAFILLFGLGLVLVSGEGAPMEVDVVAVSFVAFLVTVWIVVPALTIVTLAVLGSRVHRTKFE